MFCHLVFDIVLPTPETLTDLVNYDYMVGEGSYGIESCGCLSNNVFYNLSCLCFVIEGCCSPSL